MDLSGLIATGIVIVVVVVSLLTPNHRAFQCPKCGETFVPKKVQMLGPHSLSSRMLKCPHCGKRSMMEPAKKQK